MIIVIIVIIVIIDTIDTIDTIGTIISISLRGRQSRSGALSGGIGQSRSEELASKGVEKSCLSEAEVLCSFPKQRD